MNIFFNQWKKTIVNSGGFTAIKALHIIEKWFARHCDDLWEHSHGMTIETTDNPGWLCTIDIRVTEKMSLDLAMPLSKNWNAEMLADENKIRVYSAKIEQCLCAAAYVLSCVEMEKSDKA